jgi:steroid delta-isomerase-like uncharacterized protein
MSTEENKTLVRRNIEEVFNQGNLAVVDETIASTYTHHDPANPWVPPGPEGQKELARTYRTAFPDLHFTIEDQIAAGDRVVTRWTGRGTHRGALLGIAPTGKQFTVLGITITRMAAGKIVEAWVNYDSLGLLQQLGVIPVLGQAGS